MLKKNLWIAGLLVALTIMFVGCIEPEAEDNSGVWTTVFNLQDYIKDKPAQVLNDEKWKEIFSDTPFTACGSLSEMKAEIIVEGGVKKIKISKMANNWGMGVDIRHASDAGDKVKGAGYKEGDEITFKGTTDMGNGVVVSSKGETATNPIEGWKGEGDFDKKFTLTKNDVADIKASVKAIRIHAGGDSGPGRQGTLIIEELKIEGKRGSGDNDTISYEIPGTGEYMQPVDDGGFFLDLGLAELSKLNDTSKFPVAKITGPSLKAGKPDEKTGKITVKFDKNGQAIFIPFTADQKALVRSAIVNNYSFNVTIDGEADDTASYTAWGITDNTDTDWQITNFVSNADFASNDSGTLTIDVANKKKFTAMNGLVIKAGNGTAGTALTKAFTLTIYKIKFVIGTQSGAVTELSTINIKMDAPFPGFAAPSALDDDKNADIGGTISWSPAPIKGKFEKLTIYTATIAVYPKVGNSIKTNASVALFDAAGTDVSSTVSSSYTPATGNVTIVFPITRSDDDAWESPSYKTGATFNVKVAGVSKTATGLSTNSGNSAKVKADDSGYAFKDVTGGWQGSYPYFSVNLGEALSNFTSIKFKFKGISGDNGWKTIGVIALTSAPSGDQHFDGDAVTTGGGLLWNTGTNYDGAEAREFTATFTSDVTASTVYFLIGTHGDKKIYEISDIQFIK